MDAAEVITVRWGILGGIKNRLEAWEVSGGCVIVWVLVLVFVGLSVG